MRLESLYISKDWGNPSVYSGKITISGEAGDVQLRLNNEQTQRIIALVLDQMVETAKRVAADLTVECIEQSAAQPKLENGLNSPVEGSK